MTRGNPTYERTSPTVADRRWGKSVMEQGFCVIPSLLLRAQNQLGLSPTQLAILLQICEHWWQEDNKPHPGKKRLAGRLGIGPRQIQRHIAELERVGLVKRVERRGLDGSKRTNVYDLSGLVAKLKEIEPQFRKLNDAGKAKRERTELSRHLDQAR